MAGAGAEIGGSRVRSALARCLAIHPPAACEPGHCHGGVLQERVGREERKEEREKRGRREGEERR